MHKVALTIGGSDSSGGAGIQADLKSFMIAGVHGTSVITCITSQNTVGVKGIYPLPINEIESQLNAVIADFEFGAAKTGMLYSPEIVKLVAKKMEGKKLVVDPVLSSTTGHSLSSPDLLNAIKKHLVPSSYLLVPNVPEAEKLCGMSIHGADDAKEACKTLYKMGAKNVLIKGGHIQGDATDVLFDGKKFYVFTLPKMDRRAHGSGCTFSAFLTAFLAKGDDIVEAAKKAKAHTWSAISGGISPGRGIDIVRQRADHIPIVDAITEGYEDRGYKKQLEKVEVWLSLQNAVDELLLFLPPALVPEVGINFVYAMKGASSYEEICGIDGRIGRGGIAGKKVFQSGECRFGASKHIASIVLACMRHDGNMRSAMNVAYSEEAVDACHGAGLTVESFDRRDEPSGSSTMEWGTGYAIKKKGFVPDVVWDKGGVGKEAMVRIIGRNPGEVVEKVRNIVAHLAVK